MTDYRVLDLLYAQIRSYSGTYRRGREECPPQVLERVQRCFKYMRDKYQVKDFEQLGSSAMLEVMAQIAQWKREPA